MIISSSCLEIGKTIRSKKADGSSQMEPITKADSSTASQMARVNGCLKTEMLSLVDSSRKKQKWERMKMSPKKSQKEMK